MTNYWTSEEREASRAAIGNPEAGHAEMPIHLLRRILATVEALEYQRDALEKALSDVLFGQLGGTVDVTAERFRIARNLLAALEGKP